MNRILAFIIGFVVVAFLVRASTFIVDQRQSAIVFQLGQIKRVVSEPGLYFRIPLLQNVEYQDRRILTLDTPVTDRVQTSEKKNLLVDSFVKWRISIRDCSASAFRPASVRPRTGSARWCATR